MTRFLFGFVVGLASGGSLALIWCLNHKRFYL